MITQFCATLESITIRVDLLAGSGERLRGDRGCTRGGLPCPRGPLPVFSPLLWLWVCLIAGPSAADRHSFSHSVCPPGYPVLVDATRCRRASQSPHPLSLSSGMWVVSPVGRSSSKSAYRLYIDWLVGSAGMVFHISRIPRVYSSADTIESAGSDSSVERLDRSDVRRSNLRV